MGGLRRPDRPFPVTCVLAVVLLAAAISQRFVPSECAGPRPVPAETNLVALGERLNANSILSAISTRPFMATIWRVERSIDLCVPQRASIK